MVERFQDIITLPVPVWYNNPFDVQVIDCENDVQEELIDLQNDNDSTMRYRLHGKYGLWYHKSIVTSYPNIWKHLKLILLAFPTSYFSHVNTLLSKSRSRLDITKRGDLRLKMTNCKPNVSELAASHQRQWSH